MNDSEQRKPNRKISASFRRRVKNKALEKAEADNGGPLTATQRTRICGRIHRELQDLEDLGLLG